MSERAARHARPRPAPAKPSWALAAWVALAVTLHGRALAMPFTATDLAMIDTVLRTNLGALLRAGALPGDFAPLSRELWLWWWARALRLDVFALHALGALVAATAGWLLYRTAARWGDARAGLVAGLLWTAFPPLGILLAQVSGARELVAVLACASALAAFARERWILAGLACGAAALAGIETALLPLALLVADLSARPGDAPRARLVRLGPAFLLAAAAAFWVTRVEAGAAKALPVGVRAVPWLLGAWMPRGTWDGLLSVTRATPWLALATVGLAVLAVPGGQRPASVAREGRGASRLGVGIAIAILALVPLALAPDPPRAERFAVAAFGVALAASALASARMWIARSVVALTALLSLGANGAPLVDSGAPRFTSAGGARARSEALGALMSALRPWCSQLAAVPRTFAAGVPPDSIVRLALDPGARVACRDPRVSVRFLAEMTPDDAARAFGVLRLDPTQRSFQFEAADAEVRARVAEGLLIFARHAPAAACFESALASRPGDRELIYPTVAALAAAQRAADARTHWEEAKRAGTAPTPDTLAERLLVGFRGEDRAAVHAETARRARRVEDDPMAAAPHLDLGRYLLDVGCARSGTLEISVACGIGRRSQDVFWLARGYDAMGARLEALEAYRAALAGGLDSTAYRVARGRLIELLHELGPSAFGSRP